MNPRGIHLFLLVVISCGKEVPVKQQQAWVLSESSAHDIQGTELKNRPFVLSDASSARGATLPRYIQGLYSQISGKSATNAEIENWVAEYASGRGIDSIVNGIISKESTPETAYKKLETEFHSASTAPKSGRGFFGNDFLLLYSLFSNSNRSSTSYFLPFFLSSRQYFNYLFFSYLLK